MDEMLELIKSRRSVRSFADKKIAKEDLEKIAEAAIFAPSARNRQLWHFTVVSKKEKISALASAVAKAMGAPSGYNFYDPAAIIITSYSPDHVYGRDDCACALQNIFLASHSLGIGSVWVNQLRDCCGDPEVRALLDSFGVPHDYIASGIAALGYEAAPPRPADKNYGVINWVE
ncbi:MAG: nitroreductase [Firmicutes bacterium]|nr:nitroreductase [Bacillota bacterium]